MELAGGLHFHAKAVVYSVNSQKAFVPDWVQRATDSAPGHPVPGTSGRSETTGVDSCGDNSRNGKTAMEELELPALPGLRFSANIDLRRQSVAGQDILVVGGGMTSAQLALGAVQRGAQSVVLICKDMLRCCNQEIEV